MIAASPVSVTALNDSITPQLRSLLAALHVAVPDAYAVGGAPRDLLLGRAPLDLDIVTQGDPKAACERMAQALGGSMFALDAERGHYRLTLPESAPPREIDISQAVDLAADLARRDFTIDAMAAPVLADGSLGELIGPSGGRADAESRTLRMVSLQGLRDDPLRLLRAVRLSVELDLEIEPETEAAIRESAYVVTQAAGERQREELVRILATPRAAVGVRLLDALGLLQELMPEITAGRGVGQPFEHHYWDVFDHSVEALAALDLMLSPATDRSRWLAPVFRDGLPGFDLDAYLDGLVGGHSRRVLLKLAGLLHDVSKPETKSEQPDGRIRFFGHPEQGAAKAETICGRLRFGARETRFVSLLVEEHLRPTQLSQGDALPSKRALYRFFRDLDDAAPACLFLSLADAAAARGPRLEKDRWAGHVAYVRWVLENAPRREPAAGGAQRLVDGETLMAALGLEPGAELGRLLAAIDEAHAVGEVSTQDEAIEVARRLLASPPAAASPSPRAERGIEPSNELEQPQRHLRRPVDWSELKPRAREMRRKPTEAEDSLWQALRRKQLDGLVFRRQHPINRFVVDFYCPAKNLVVEVDGAIHDQSREMDRARQEFLESLGLHVLRFSNDAVLHNSDAVLNRIRAAATDIPTETSPSLLAGRGTEGERLDEAPDE
jgi:poly(A) polymerase